MVSPKGANLKQSQKKAENRFLLNTNLDFLIFLTDFCDDNTNKQSNCDKKN